MVSEIWRGHADRVLLEFGLSAHDLDPYWCLVLITEGALASGASDGIVAAGERSLAEVCDSNVISGIVFDVLSNRDRMLLREARDRAAVPEPLLTWKVVVFTRGGWRGFLMARGTSAQYQARIADELKDLLHDADEIG